VPTVTIIVFPLAATLLSVPPTFAVAAKTSELAKTVTPKLKHQRKTKFAVEVLIASPFCISRSPRNSFARIIGVSTRSLSLLLSAPSVPLCF